MEAVSFIMGIQQTYSLLQKEILSLAKVIHYTNTTQISLKRESGGKAVSASVH